MKTHAIIPIFLPHIGCPNDCVFCNQRAITSKLRPVSVEEVTGQIERCLSTMEGRGLSTMEIAFFGGSFTGIPPDQQRDYLAAAKKYKDAGRIHQIRLSTRPDYIDPQILSLLSDYGVDLIELGVQSLDDQVLLSSGRGHDSDSVREASRLISDAGFTLGVQLMIGLPGDSYESCLYSAREAIRLNPAIARLYPTVILKNTELARRYESGQYVPPTLRETVRRAKDMYLALTGAGIQVIRVGLKSTDGIGDQREVLGNTFHPAFRQLMESEIAREALERQLHLLMPSGKTSGQVVFTANGPSFSNLVGHGKSNRIYFKERYPELRFFFRLDQTLEDGVYQARFDSPAKREDEHPFGASDG